MSVDVALGAGEAADLALDAGKVRADAGLDPGADAGPEGGGEQCVDVGTDPRNCGTCGTACPFGQVCFRNRCDAICGGRRVLTTVE